MFRCCVWERFCRVLIHCGKTMTCHPTFCGLSLPLFPVLVRLLLLVLESFFHIFILEVLQVIDFIRNGSKVCKFTSGSKFLFFLNLFKLTFLKSILYTVSTLLQVIFQELGCKIVEIEILFMPVFIFVRSRSQNNVDVVRFYFCKWVYIN